MPAATPKGEWRVTNSKDQPLLAIRYSLFANYFFLPAIDLAGPLRVRALVWVR